MFKTAYKCMRYAQTRNKKIFPLWIIYTLTSGLLPLCAVFIPKVIIAEILKGDSGSINNIIIYCISFFCISAVLGFITIYTRYMARPLLIDTRIDLLSDVFEKLSSLDYHYTESTKFYDDNGRALKATNGGDDGYENMIDNVFHVFSPIITIIFYMIILFFLSYIIVIAVLVSVIIGVLISMIIQKIEYKLKDKLEHNIRKMNYFYEVTHDFSYGKDIRVYDFQDKINKGYTLEINNYIRLIKLIANKSFLFGFIEIIGLLISDFLIYYILIKSVLNGMTIDNFSMYLTASLALSTTLKQLSTIIISINKNHLICYDLFVFLKTDFNENKGTKKKLEDTLEIEFVDVSFKYPHTDNYIFENLNFKINAKEKLAIVGVNGAGKTTLVKLITRLFEPTSGTIFVNGIDAKEFDKKAYYEMFSVVFQEIHMLAFPVRENITLGHKSDDERIWECLQKVGLYEKIKNLPNGLDTMMLKNIDENGLLLSGGEQQKLAIARALYKNGNMVILDEPTSALDALAEATIYQDFNSLVSSKTAVYISHRLASTKFCDHIALFDGKTLAEYGTHDELMKMNSKYYEMFVTQGKYYQMAGEENE